MSRLTDYLIARDFPSFVHECHKICRGGKTLNDDPYLLLAFSMAEDIISGDCPRAIINLPPGTAKSFIFATCLSTWILAQDASASVLVVEHSKKLARDTTRQIRKIMLSSSFKRNFKTRIDDKWKGAGDFGTTAGGSVFATSIDGTITGYRADLIIVDDPLPIKEANNISQIEYVNETFDTEIASRTRDEHSRILVVMHRLHEQDLSAHLEKQGDYKVLAISMIAEKPTTYTSRYGAWHRAKGEQVRRKRYSKKELRRLAFQPGFRFLYQQGKSSGASFRVKSKHFEFFDGRYDRSRPFVFSIDAAQKANANSSQTAIQVWQRNGADHYLIDLFSAKSDYARVWKALELLVRRYPPSMILIEDTAGGSALISQAKSRLPYEVRGVIPSEPKFTRLHRHFGTIRRGHIHVPEAADWSADWIEEIVAFPNGDYDDQADALSMYLDFMASRPILKPPKERGGIGAMVGSTGSRFQIPTTDGGQQRTPGYLAFRPSTQLFAPLTQFVGARPRIEPPVRIQTQLGTVLVRRR